MSDRSPDTGSAVASPAMQRQDDTSWLETLAPIFSPGETEVLAHALDFPARFTPEDSFPRASQAFSTCRA